MRSLLFFSAVLVASAGLIEAQNAAIPTLITSSVDESRLVTLPRNTHPLAKPAFDTGAAPATLPMDRMLLVLKRSAAQEAALEKLLSDQQTPGSADYHRWLTPQQFGQTFGMSDQDLKTVTDWLTSHGFTIDHVSNGRTIIEFSGNASQVHAAFHTAVHQFTVNGKAHWANVQDPQVPAALAPAIAGVASLHNFIAKPQVKVTGEQIHATLQPGAAKPLFTNGSQHALAPADYGVIYNLNPLFKANVNGTGVVLAVVGRTNIIVQDVVSFRSVFGLPNNPPNVILNGPNPGDLGGDEEIEALLDTSWSGATAPNATIDLVVSKTTNTTDGVTLSEEYIIDNNLANVMTESFGDCEANYTASQAAGISSMAQQAAADGITYLVSSGDSGSAGCDDPNSESSATAPLSVNILASSQYDIAVGGTQLNDGAGGYWSSTNNATYGSALSYIPEDVWNENCNGSSCSTGSILAGGGGASVYFPKPTWQTGVSGIPNDGARDVPDVAFPAGLYDPYLICVEGSCTPNSKNQISFTGVGGTSAAAPSFAGMMALVNQKTGARQGQAATVLYKLAAAETLANCNASNTSALPASTCIFNDVTIGTNAVPGEANYNSGAETYPATFAYDQASGLGSVNAANLVNGWSGAGTGSTNAIAITPSSGSAVTQTFTIAYTSTNQAQEHLLFNTTLTGNGACYFLYNRAQNSLSIANDQGSAVLESATPGSSATLANDQCSAPASSFTASSSGNTLTLSITITFSPSFVGAKNVYGNIVNGSGVAGNWEQIGTWTVPAASGNTIAIGPSSGSGATQTFRIAYTSTSQAQEHLLFNTTLSGNGACYFIYDRNQNTLSIANDQGNGLLASATPGSSTTLANDQCSAPASTAAVSTSGNTVTLTLTITFTSSFGGAKTVYGNMFSQSYMAGTWQQIGTWTVPGSTTSPIVITPSSGSGVTQKFAIAYTSANQAQEHVLFNASLTGSGACYFIYDRNQNTLSIANDQGSGVLASATPGSSTTLANDQCSAPASSATVSVSGNTVTLTLTITFAPSFTGAKNVYGNMLNQSYVAGTWQQIGTWTP